MASSLGVIRQHEKSVRGQNFLTAYNEMIKRTFGVNLKLVI